MTNVELVSVVIDLAMLILTAAAFLRKPRS
jgi:hypothetical protein